MNLPYDPENPAVTGATNNPAVAHVPENGAGATQVMPPDPTGAKRTRWSQREIAELVTSHTAGATPDAIAQAFAARGAVFSPAEVLGKLMGLGLVQKPAAAQSGPHETDRRAIDEFVGKLRLIHAGTGQHAGDPKRADLALRYLIRAATDLRKSLGTTAG